MAITLDLSIPRNQVRVNIGDADAVFLSDAVIDFLLTDNSDNVSVASIKAIDIILAEVAKKIDQEVGDEEARFSQLYDHYKDLHRRLTKDPSSSLSVFLPFFGGTSKSEAERVNNNTDTRRIRIREGFSENLDTDCFPNRHDVFSLDCDD